MIIKVTDSKGRYLGYILDNIWIPEEFLWIYTSLEELSYSKIKKGTRKKYNICIENIIYNNILYSFFSKEYIDEVFNSNNIELNDIILLSFKDLDYNIMSSIWKLPTSSCERFVFYSRGKPIGYILIKGSFRNDILYISMFETPIKGKGYGAKCINFLLSHKSLVGYSVINAKGFWQKMGAVYDDEENYRFKIQGGFDKNELL